MNINQICWTEKYRPKTIREILGQDHIIPQLEEFIKEKNIPHLLFTGNAGIGKTTTALALIHDIQGKDMKSDITYLELNASDSRGIDTVRNEIKKFAKIMPPSSLSFKIIILDECDAMTIPAQQALRRIMEIYSSTCRFILICNYINKIIPPIQSRTAFIQFYPITNEIIKRKLNSIVLMENVNIELEAIDTIVEMINGDLRKGITILQTSASIYSNKIITANDIISLFGYVTSDEIKQMVNNMLSFPFDISFTQIKNIILNRGISVLNFIKQINKEIVSLPYSDKIKIEIIKILGETERNLTQGASELIQLCAMIIKISELNKMNI